MNTQQILEIIENESNEVKKLIENFRHHSSIPQIYVDLTLSKVKNLYAELLLLQKGDLSKISLDDINTTLDTESGYVKSTAGITYQTEKANENPGNGEPKKESVTHQTANEELDSAKKEPKNENLQRKREEHFLATQLKYDPIKDIKKSISLNEKIWFIKELFHGNIEIYNETLDRLNNYSDLEKALEYLDNNFDWDYDNQTVKNFMEHIYRKFI